MALHEQSVGKTDEWYTPKYIFDALGCQFEVDVASPEDRTHCCVPAKKFITKNNFLFMPWEGFIWMNPPFGGRNGLDLWLDKFFHHHDGIALVPDRTSAPWWQKAAQKSDAILFVSPKIKFIDKNGQAGKSPAQGTTLMASGSKGIEGLIKASRNSLGIMLKK